MNGRDLLTLFIKETVPNNPSYQTCYAVAYAGANKGLKTYWADLHNLSDNQLNQIENTQSFIPHATYDLENKIEGVASRSAQFVRMLNCFWVDIDSGEGKPYPDVPSCITAIKEFCQKTRAPAPVWFVLTGNGLHCYWPLIAPITADAWQRIADLLKTACKAYGLHADHGITADRARIMRAVGGKTKSGQQVAAKRTAGGLIDPVELYRALQAACDLAGVAPPAPTPLTASTRAEYSAAELFIRTMADEPGACGHVHNWATQRWSEPYWRAALSFIALSSDSDEVKRALYMRVSHIGEGDAGEWDQINRRVINIVNSGANPYSRASLTSLVDNDPCAQCSLVGMCHSPVTAALLPPADSLPPIPVAMPLVEFKATQTLIDRDGEEVEVASVATAAAPAQILCEMGDVTFYSCDPDRLGDPYAPPETWAVVRAGKKSTNVKIAGFVATCVAWQKNSMTTRGVFECASSEPYGLRIEQVSISSADLINAETVSRVFAHKGFTIMNGGMFSSLTRDSLDRAQHKVVKGTLLRSLGWDTCIRQDPPPTSFIFADRAITAKGYTHAAVDVDYAGDAIVFAERTAGSIDGWRDGIARMVPNDPTAMHQQLAIAASFGAPLNAFGEMGGTILIASAQSGTGKTAACQLAMSVWGDPTKAMINAHTSVVTIERARGAFNSLPVHIDEVTVMEHAMLRDLLYSSTIGTGKTRSDNRGQAGAIPDSWTAYCFMTSNKSLSNYTLGRTDEAEGITARVLEVPARQRRQSSDVSELPSFIGSQYGHVGRAYALWLLSNLPLARDVHRMYADRVRDVLISKNKYTDMSRFWISMSASIMTGAQLAHGLKYISFDLAALEQYVGDLVLSMADMAAGESATNSYSLGVAVASAGRHGTIVDVDAPNTLGSSLHNPSIPAGSLSFRSISRGLLWVPRASAYEYQRRHNNHAVRGWGLSGSHVRPVKGVDIFEHADQRLDYFEIPINDPEVIS